jgi:hypothetical protein
MRLPINKLLPSSPSSPCSPNWLIDARRHRSAWLMSFQWNGSTSELLACSEAEHTARTPMMKALSRSHVSLVFGFTPGFAQDLAPELAPIAKKYKAGH